jgi:hypothetical protein
MSTAVSESALNLLDNAELIRRSSAAAPVSVEVLLLQRGFCIESRILQNVSQAKGFTGFRERQVAQAALA